MNDSGNLVKMIIVSYKKRKGNGKKREKEFEFEIPVNPETYSKNCKVQYDLKTPHGNQGADGKYSATPPEEFKLEFILDGTSTIQNYGNKAAKPSNLKERARQKTDPNPRSPDFVEMQIKSLLDVIYKMEGESHRPRFCEIVWGDVLFRGVLSNLDINYTLFHPSGKPLRAKVSTTFVEYIAKEEREKIQKKRSPDLTRIRRIKGSDKLDSMAYEFYDNPNFIIQIAKANNLTSFRKIKVGTELRFPPIDKTEVV